MKVYHIPGSLTQQKGEVNYRGSIRIDGDVTGKIQIRTGGSILIGGNVDGASIEAEGDITIRGSVTSSGSKLESRRCITIGKEAEGADIRCHGDLTLAGRLMRCVIRIQGRINGKTAILRDCHVCALGGILLQAAECSGPGACILKVGINYTVIEEITALDEALERKRFELQHLLNTLGPMLKRALHDRDYGRRLGGDIDTEMSRARTFKEEAQKMEREMQLLGKRSSQNGVACVSVARALQKGTQLKAERAFLLISENTNGPISFVPDRSGATFVSEKGLLLEMLAT